MRNFFANLIVLLFAIFSIAQAAWLGLSDPDAEDVKFTEFNKEDENYYYGDKITFKIEIENERHRDEYTDKRAKVYLVRSRIGPNVKFLIEDAAINPVEGEDKFFTVSGTVPKVDKEADYYILIRRPSKFGFLRTIANSLYSKIKHFLTLGKRTTRRIKVSPEEAPLPAGPNAQGEEVQGGEGGEEEEAE